MFTTVNRWHHQLQKNGNEEQKMTMALYRVVYWQKSEAEKSFRARMMRQVWKSRVRFAYGTTYKTRRDLTCEQEMRREKALTQFEDGMSNVHTCWHIMSLNNTIN